MAAGDAPCDPDRPDLEGLVQEVTPMSQAQVRSRSRARHFTLNSDGERHPLLNAATAYTFIAGLAAFVAGLVLSLHLVATVLGGTGFFVGMSAQMVSATREQRMFIVVGIVGSFVGMGLGLAHGGF
jgi:hypothetical protein